MFNLKHLCVYKCTARAGLRQFPSCLVYLTCFIKKIRKKLERILFSERTTYRSSNKWSFCYLRSDVKPLRTNGGRFWANQILCRIKQLVFVHKKKHDNNNNNSLLQSIQQSEVLHLQYLHYKSKKKIVINNIEIYIQKIK